MKKIGITGGIGAGKSYVLEIIKENCNCMILRADYVANELKLPGEACYEPIVELLSKDVLDENKFISHTKMASMIFADESLRIKVNSIIHPAVKQYILNAFKKAETEGYEFFFVEAALLIEDHYREILDEIWYVRASKEVRISRLIDSRGYSRQKALGIIDKQLSDTEFMENSDRVIDNDGNFELTKNTITELLKTI